MTSPNGDGLREHARKNLQQAITDLHRSAGLPSSRAISAAVRGRDDLRDTVSHETVNAILRGDGVPRWVKLECVVRQLADWAAHRPDPDLTTRTVQELWLACQQSAKDDGEASLPQEQGISAEMAAQAIRENSIVILSEEASLSFQDSFIEVVIVRHILNQGPDPLGEYPVKVSVDRYPEEPSKSKDLYQKHPLTWSDLTFESRCNGSPMAWRSTFDRPNAKGILVLFENDHESFPILPGCESIVTYSYTVPTGKWGLWFQRKVNFQTRRIAIMLDFPSKLRPVVWGEIVDPLKNDGLKRIPLTPESDTDGRLLFKWAPKDARVRSSYRVSWGFRTRRNSDDYRSSLPAE